MLHLCQEAVLCQILRMFGVKRDFSFDAIWIQARGRIRCRVLGDMIDIRLFNSITRRLIFGVWVRVLPMAVATRVLLRVIVCTVSSHSSAIGA